MMAKAPSRVVTAIDFSLESGGIPETLAALKELPRLVEQKIMRTALRAAAKPIWKAAREKAPVDTGNLRDSITIKARRQTKKNVQSVIIHPGFEWYKGDNYYAMFVEFGHRIGKRPSRGKLRAYGRDVRAEVPPHPFMRPAFDERKEEAKRSFRVSLERDLHKAMTGARLLVKRLDLAYKTFKVG